MLNPHSSLANKSQPALPLSGITRASGGDAAKNNTQFPGSLNYTSVVDYQLGGLLGSGNYANVKKATHKATGFVVAIKVYDKFKLSANAQVKKSVQREIRLLSELSNTDRGYTKETRQLNFG